MCRPNASDPAQDLHDDVGTREGRCDLAAQPERERYRRVEMRARNRAKHRDDHVQHTARRNRVGQQCNRIIPVSKGRAHDARANNADQQKGGAQPFGGKFTDHEGRFL